ncbi:hypothetical protein BV917_13985 [Leptospira santarosai serovar Guaricura]|nr:hypothetical protein BV917_13985 [Leptospira santarosai serovar Guaricura]
MKESVLFSFSFEFIMGKDITMIPVNSLLIYIDKTPPFTIDNKTTFVTLCPNQALKWQGTQYGS